MNTLIDCPTWADMETQQGTVAAALQQLVNAAGPVSGGIAVALNMILRAQQADDAGDEAPLNPFERAQLLTLCAVSAQMLNEVAADACNDLVSACFPP